jgi:hypothetical protein
MESHRRVTEIRVRWMRRSVRLGRAAIAETATGLVAPGEFDASLIDGGEFATHQLQNFHAELWIDPKEFLEAIGRYEAEGAIVLRFGGKHVRLNAECRGKSENGPGAEIATDDRALLLVEHQDASAATRYQVNTFAGISLPE